MHVMLGVLHGQASHVLTQFVGAKMVPSKLGSAMALCSPALSTPTAGIQRRQTTWGPCQQRLAVESALRTSGSRNYMTFEPWW